MLSNCSPSRPASSQLSQPPTIQRSQPLTGQPSRPASSQPSQPLTSQRSQPLTGKPPSTLTNQCSQPLTSQRSQPLTGKSTRHPSPNTQHTDRRQPLQPSNRQPLAGSCRVLSRQSMRSSSSDSEDEPGKPFSILFVYLIRTCFY